jgi:hypothetical protein
MLKEPKTIEANTSYEQADDPCRPARSLRLVSPAKSSLVDKPGWKARITGALAWRLLGMSRR